MNKHHQHHHRHPKLYKSPLTYSLQKLFEFCILKGSNVLIKSRFNISPPPPVKQHPQHPQAFELVEIVSFNPLTPKIS